MWTYSQSTGDLYHNGTYEGRGYSGHGVGVNNSALEKIPCTGPIPRGAWVIGQARDDPHLGLRVFPLTPGPDTNTFGRSGFFIHGDNSLVNETGSEGCIVLGRTIRDAIVLSGDRQLTVVG